MARNRTSLFVSASLVMLIAIGLALTTAILTLSYLGTSFESVKPLDASDWRRKWLIFFAWFNLVGLGLLVLSTAGLAIPPLALPIMTNIIALSYLGTTFTPSTPQIEGDDWKRRWMIFFAWLSIAMMIIQVFMMVKNWSIIESDLRRDMTKL